MSWVLLCESCGDDRLRPGGSRRTATHAALVLVCETCKAEVTLEAGSVRNDVGECVSADATPERMIPVGGNPDDPWVWFRARMLHSQREVIYQAQARARAVAGIPDGPLTSGAALEWACADFLAGAT